MSAAELPPPIEMPWVMKPRDSATTAVEHLPDGRIKWSIVHDTLAGVTPSMIVWWLNHMDGDVEIGGTTMARYRAWHPRDHVAVTYVKKSDAGTNMGVGSKVRIQEYFARNPEHRVDVVDDVLRLDEGGFVHVHAVAGIELARMEYTFAKTPGGTRYENCLIVGMSAPVIGAPFNGVVRPRIFSDEMGDAWMTHNIEEVGNLEHFLPGLFAASAGASPRGPSP